MPTAKSKSLHEAVNLRVSARLWAHSRLLVALIVGLLVAVPLDGAMTQILAAGKRPAQFSAVPCGLKPINQAGISSRSQHLPFPAPAQF